MRQRPRIVTSKEILFLQFKNKLHAYCKCCAFILEHSADPKSNIHIVRAYKQFGTAILKGTHEPDCHSLF